MTKQQILDELSKATARLSPCNHKTNSQYITEVLRVQYDLLLLENRLAHDIEIENIADGLLSEATHEQ